MKIYYNKAKSSEIYVSVKLACLKLLDSFRHLTAGSEYLSTTITSFPALYRNGMENELFKTKWVYPYQKFQTAESFFEPINL